MYFVNVGGILNPAVTIRNINLICIKQNWSKNKTKTPLCFMNIQY